MRKSDLIIKLIILLFISIFIDSSLFAKEWTVNNKNDSGNSSLREIINLTDAGDTILLKTDSIFLTTKQITLTKDIVIIGEKTIIKRQSGEFRIINIENPINVHLENVIISNGIGPNNPDREHEPFKGGGGIYIANASAKLLLKNCSFIGNKTKDDPYNVNRTSSGGYGGAIFIENGTTIIDSCYFTDNTTGNGNKGLSFGGNGGKGGAIYKENGQITIRNSVFEKNHTGHGDDNKGGAGGNGGAIFNKFGQLEIANTIFISNSTGNGGNGTMEAFEYGTIHYASGQGGDGAAIYIQSGSCNINDCNFIKNKTGKGGNGNNGASGGDGGSGGAILQYQGKLTLQNCNFSNNSCGNAGNSGDPDNAYCVGSVYCGGGSGGALFIKYANTFIYNCKFEYNFTGNGANSKKDGSGGAIYLTGSTYDDFILMNSLFNGNYTTTSDSATGGSNGGALFIDSWEGKIYNSTFAYNKAISNGGAIYNTDEISINNCILAYNTANQKENEVYTSNSHYESATFNYSLVFDQDNIGNTNASFSNCVKEGTNPYFDLEEDTTFNLLPYSQCINGGNPNFQNEHSDITVDLANNQRVEGDIVDIGAYEYNNNNCAVAYNNIEASICEKDYFPIGDSLYNETGRYVNALISSEGCDSIVILKLEVEPMPTINLGNDTTISTQETLILTPNRYYPEIIWNDSVSQSYFVIDSTMGIGTFPITVMVTNNYGCTNYDTINVTIVTDSLNNNISDIQKSDIKVYPNPTNGLIYIDSNAIIDKVILYNESGIPLFKREPKHKTGLNISNYPCGIYYLLIIDSNNSSIVRKIIKK